MEETGGSRPLFELTLPPTFIQRERDSGLEFCPFGRVGQRGLARYHLDWLALSNSARVLLVVVAVLEGLQKPPGRPKERRSRIG